MNIDQLKETQKPQVLVIEGQDGTRAPVLLVPDGPEKMAPFEGKEFLDVFLKAPERRRGTATLESLSSFVQHVGRFREEHTAIFIRREPTQIQSVYDYSTKDAPRFGEHRATFDFKPTTAWRAWKDAHGKDKTQAAFAEFLEDHSADIIDPEHLPISAMMAIREAEIAIGTKCVHPEAIRALAAGLEYHLRCKRADIVNLRNGTRSVKFEETIEGKSGETLDIPGLFAIAVELFDARMPPRIDPATKDVEPDRPSRYVVPVRLRVRAGKVSEGEGAGLIWTMLLHNVDRCIDLALSEAAERVAQETSCPVFWGSPEK